MTSRILLSFDIEEFEMPREYGNPIPFDLQMEVSIKGTERILDLLKQHDIKGTFYTTANFAQHAKHIVHRIVKEGHELASHGYVHDHFEPHHLKLSKDILEEIGNIPVYGYRMARMMPVPEEEVYKAGYIYNSSINPTYLPGRYNKLNEPRTYFYRENVLQLPASVSPLLRFPLFWISFHNLPASLYRGFVKRTVKKDGYLNTYFHPWEFMDIGPKKKYNFPFYVTRNTDNRMVKRMNDFIIWCKHKGYEFERTCDFVQAISNK
ncbi:peptidoglycan/xylan/chitin deacetylase (PgdA/CDA1 family) [Dysgonomonas hofstadii]|uniref:Peptidoglycan/xylan/chitin deacetylase (PgdA/CDA1 family) n=1 Tax=Dysgonomonas hofstadii TaxID=637886 RepID=A0A840CPB5_9BACT|nr:polysaccharide deacetylase family protein [Dysgonomonas hofstadii]MBB4035938.1 peptidoglycan/xylan/chitin deacetylase (PgdA/CDA1 family) [Dysgonomonas hofstadii]